MEELIVTIAIEEEAMLENPPEKLTLNSKQFFMDVPLRFSSFSLHYTNKTAGRCQVTIENSLYQNSSFTQEYYFDAAKSATDPNNRAQSKWFPQMKKPRNRGGYGATTIYDRNLLI